jgi:hypothetical protein
MGHNRFDLPEALRDPEEWFRRMEFLASEGRLTREEGRELVRVAGWCHAEMLAAQAALNRSVQPASPNTDPDGAPLEHEVVEWTQAQWGRLGRLFQILTLDTRSRAMLATQELARFPWLVVGMLSASVRKVLVERRMHEDARALFDTKPFRIAPGFSMLGDVESPEQLEPGDEPK